MKISFNPISQRINPQFKSSYSSYRIEDGRKMGTFTWFFRQDLDWEKFIRYQTECFKGKDKVNIVQFAASDGTEAYTYIMSLFEYGSEKDVEKFCPIKAYDINNGMVRLASGDYINIYPNDEAYMDNKRINWTEYFSLVKTEPSTYDKASLYTVKPKLKQRVNFAQGDMFELVNRLKDNSNTILLCRNCLGYFHNQPERVEQFIQTASDRLKENSLFVIGRLEEEEASIQALLRKHNFGQVMRNVFQKL